MILKKGEIMKVALIGKGYGKEHAPLKGRGVVTWGVNDIVGHRDVDVCFFMDKHLMQDTQMDELVKKSVAVTNTPVYCCEHYDDIPTSIPYPRDEVFATFGTDYFADSFCYMIALALYQGFREFDIYGFNYSVGHKYVHEKPCCSMWLGMALGMGCTLNFNGKECELFKTVDGKVYSYLDDQSMPRQGIKVRDFSFPAGEYEFSTDDRFCILGLLPHNGHYNEIKLAQKVHQALSFTKEENKQLNIRQIEDKKDPNTPKFIWDDNDLPPRKLELTEAQLAILKAWLYQLDMRGGLNFRNLKLYERFCK